MAITINGRPMTIGQRFFEHYENGGYQIKFCAGYCKCGRKIGLTRDQLNQFAQNMPGIIPDFISRLVRTRIISPK